MNKLLKICGMVAFWLGWPLLWLILDGSRRSRVLIVAEGQILLVKGWLGMGEWALPGGGLHRGESDKAGAIREVKEETGLTLKASQLKPLYEGKATRYGLKFNYVCFLVELPAVINTSKQRLEIAEIDWLSQKQLQSIDLTEDTQQALTAWRSTPDLLK